MPTQPSICHNTAEPTVCLLNLLYATILPNLLYACLAFYMPQYNRAYCMPAQPSICHNTPCVLQYKKKKQPFKSQYNTSIAIQFFHCTPLYCNTVFQPPSLAIHSCILQYNFHQSSSLQYNPLPTRLGHNTLIVLQYNSNSPLASLIAIQFSVLQYNFPALKLSYCNTIATHKLYCNTLP